MYKGYHKRTADCEEPAYWSLSNTTQDDCLEACDTDTNCTAVAHYGNSCELRNTTACFDLVSASSKTVYSKVPDRGKHNYCIIIYVNSKYKKKAHA